MLCHEFFPENKIRMSRKHSVAVLFHLDQWVARREIIPIAPGISMCRLEGSKVEKLYHALCKAGHDDGEPYMFRSFVRFDSTDDHQFPLDFGDPYSHVDRFCNLFALCQQHPIGLARLISSPDDFETSDITETIYVRGGQTDLLENDHDDLTDRAISDIRTAWRTTDALWRKSKSSGRISNALTFFYYAWRSHYLEQVCLNLVITLECLFAPHQSGETTHQIAFAVAHFAGRNRSEREHLFDFIKRLYALRSTVIHGGHADEDKLITLVPKAFNLVSMVLLDILTQPAEARKFESELDRRELLRGFHFNAKLDVKTKRSGHTRRPRKKELCCLINPVQATCLRCRQEGFCEDHLRPCRVA